MKVNIGPTAVVFIVLLEVVRSGYVRNGRGFTLSCLARQVDCTVSWDPACCTGQLEAVRGQLEEGSARNFESMANYRFGTLFRNSIPPPRQYSPPTFDDIFGNNKILEKKLPDLEEENRKEEEEKEIEENNKEVKKPTEKIAINLKLPSQVGQLKVPQKQGLDSTYLTKLNLLKLKQYQQMFMKKHNKATRTDKPSTSSTTPTPTTATTITTTTSYPATFLPFFRSSLSSSVPRLPERNRNGFESEPGLANQENLGTIKNAEPSENTANEKLHENPQNGPDRFFARRKIKPSRKRPEYEESRENAYTSPSSHIIENNWFEDTTQGYKESNDNNPLYLKPVSFGTERYQTSFKIKTTSEPRVASFSGHNFIDMSSNTRIRENENKPTMLPSSNPSNPSISLNQPTTFNPEGEILNTFSENIYENILEIEEKKEKEKKNQDDQFTEELCNVLRVPCRFVTEHPCCVFTQGIDMVARPRAMDGSADLRWRYMQSGQEDSNLKVPQGRMLSGFPVSKTSGDTSFTSRKHDNSIHYNYALSKDVVSVPVYHYNGGPHVTTTILSQCWRLTYLHCDQETEHPCCALAVAGQTKQYNSLSTSVLDKWLVRS